MRKIYRVNAMKYVNDISEFSELDIIESINAFAAKM
jgi:hypothetical protein